MPFTWVEHETSRKSTLNPPTYELKFLASGEPNDAIAFSYALATTPAGVATPFGLIYRQDIKIDPDGYGRYMVTVPYARTNKNNGSFTVNFDTTGATVKIKSAREHIHTYTASGVTMGSNPHDGSIGVKPDGDCEGADIVIPCLKLNVQFQHDQGQITIPQIKQLAYMTGKTNQNPWLGGQFLQREMLFLGCTGQEGTSAPTNITYQFAASQNQTGLTIGSILGIAKKGWEYAWVEFMPGGDSNNNALMKTKAVHIERTYDEVDFASILGFGG